MNDRINAMTVFDDGSGGGAALFAGGFFTTASGIPAAGIAKWTGAAWQPLGSNLNLSQVLDLAVFDPDGAGGGGPQLFAAGGGSGNSLRRWTGDEWVGVPGAPTTPIGSLHVHDAGDGPELYVSGPFISFPTLEGPTEYIARWNGTQWRSTGDGLISVTQDYATFDDGTGSELYAVGGFGFFVPGHPMVIGFGEFDGKTWTGTGRGFNTGAVYALTAFDDGRGEALFAGGAFNTAGGTSTLNGGIAANRIARWDGTAWSTLGSGMNGEVHSLEVFDEDGDGPQEPALFAGGMFTTAGGVPAGGIAKWDGTTWSPVGGGVAGAVLVMHASPDASGLFVGGNFAAAGAQPAGNIAVWTCGPTPHPGDIDGSGSVNVDDLLAVINAWGPCADPDSCPADVAPAPGGNDVVNVDDLLMVINNWG